MELWKYFDISASGIHVYVTSQEKITNKCVNVLNKSRVILNHDGSQFLHSEDFKYDKRARQWVHEKDRVMHVIVEKGVPNIYGI